MAFDTQKARTFVEGLLREKKSLTEREVKAAVAKALKVSPKQVGAGLIRDVRRSMGIDRPAALAFARQMLAKDARVPATTVITAVTERFGIRLGPPDVSRLRPRKAKTGRPPRGKAPKGAPAAALMKGAVRPAGKQGPKGAITVTFEGTGAPDDLASFFLALGHEA